MVTDVAQIYRSMDPALAEPVLEQARRLGCERILLVGAHLAATLLEAPIPVAIGARVAADRAAVESVAARVLRGLFTPAKQATPFGDSPHIFSRLLFNMRERGRDRLTYLIQTTTTPTTVHFQRFGLPEWAYPAYRILVPAHDYVFAPIARGLRAFLAPTRSA